MRMLRGYVSDNKYESRCRDYHLELTITLHHLIIESCTKQELDINLRQQEFSISFKLAGLKVTDDRSCLFSLQKHSTL